MTDESDGLPRSPQRVRETYDYIAEHFSETRYAPWPEVQTFLDSVNGGTVGLDVGCGNGRHLPLLGERVEVAIGLDSSRGLLEEAAAREDLVAEPVSFLQADAAALPLAADSVSLALSVATVHHLSDRETRIRSLGELGRVLESTGTALVSAWSTAHDRFEDAEAGDETGFDTTIGWTLPGGETVPRFYHIYAPAEFDADLERAGLEVLDNYVSSGNCYAEVRA